LFDIIVTKLKHLQGYQFNVQFDEKCLPDLSVDEVQPIGDSSGPNPPRLLSAAIGHCLSSSLLYCLRKARVTVNSLEVIVQTHLERSAENRLRVPKINVLIDLGVAAEDEDRASRCLELFENFCTVTQSVRKGIAVEVKVT
jgi:uncharacterized OsmC-like protein